MNNGKYVFAQLTEFLPKRVFNCIVVRYDGDKYVRHFSCWNQMLCMVFGQLTNRDSLRGLVVAIEAHSRKTYHLGFGKSVTRSNLSKVNEKRDCKIFEEFAYHLIDLARRKQENDNFEIKGKVYAFDSSTIDLCLSVFWWARFRKTKGRIKLHTLYDITTQIPAFILISAATVNIVNAMDYIPYESGAYYIFDSVYVDYERLFKIAIMSAFFDVRAKSNLKFRRMYSRKVDKTKGVQCDQMGKLTGFYVSKVYPDKLRRVKFYNEQTKRTFVFLSNNMELSAEQIALLYKNRWQVELFFKWIKQHLKIKSFWGTSENAVRIQIYTAIIAYCLVTVVGHDLKIDRSTYEILQILGISLLGKTPVSELFTSIDYKDVKELYYKQLSLSLF